MLVETSPLERVGPALALAVLGADDRAVYSPGASEKYAIDLPSGDQAGERSWTPGVWVSGYADRPSWPAP